MQSYQVNIDLKEGGTKPVVFVAENEVQARVLAASVYSSEGTIGDAVLMDDAKMSSFMKSNQY